MVYQYPEKPSCNLIFLSIYEYLHKWSVQKKIYYQDVLHALLSILYMVAAPLVFFFFFGGGPEKFQTKIIGGTTAKN